MPPVSGQGCTGLATAHSCFEGPKAAPAIGFPFEGARVFIDQSVLSAHAVWLEAGSSRHVLGVSPAQLARVTSALTADLLREARTGEVADVPRG